ncbi:hypothetical protein [Candidatus Accumulibacter sp. ACC003]|uniref:hypothetical protein n=1 Tax=Candidatus Accumulibacter sp. ACC003 TaxID=2823334 RepID=UPI0025BDFB1E|nr:hypothetical protein [Candidatus Accumulibacter sp. ACC003]
MTDPRWPRELGPVLCGVGAQPGFMKMAAILRAGSARHAAVPTVRVHASQQAMNDRLFADLHLPYPEISGGRLAPRIAAEVAASAWRRPATAR